MIDFDPDIVARVLIELIDADINKRISPSVEDVTSLLHLDQSVAKNLLDYTQAIYSQMIKWAGSPEQVAKSMGYLDKE